MWEAMCLVSVQEQSTAHLKLRDLSSKYVQIAGAGNSLNVSNSFFPSCRSAVVPRPEEPGRSISHRLVALVPSSGLLLRQAEPLAYPSAREHPGASVPHFWLYAKKVCSTAVLTNLPLPWRHADLSFPSTIKSLGPHGLA